MNISCILLGAGIASRFGADKLTRTFLGIPLGVHALRLHATFPYHEKVLVTQRRHASLIAPARELGFQVVFNDAPEQGISSSIRLGLEALDGQENGILFGVCDQPFLSADTITALLECATAHPTEICAPFYDGQRGNPVVFPTRFREELATLTGDTGGGKVIRNHPEAVLRVERPSLQELDDIDTIQDLHALEERKRP